MLPHGGMGKTVPLLIGASLHWQVVVLPSWMGDAPWRAQAIATKRADAIAMFPFGVQAFPAIYTHFR